MTSRENQQLEVLFISAQIKIDLLVRIYSLQKLYGNWNSDWVRNSFHPPLYTQFLRVLPQECNTPCCMNIKLYSLKEGRPFFVKKLNKKINIF